MGVGMNRWRSALAVIVAVIGFTLGTRAALAADVVARLELDRSVTDFLYGADPEHFKPVYASLVIENQSDRKQTVTLKPSYQFRLRKVSPADSADINGPYVAGGTLKSAFLETRITVTVLPHTQLVVAYGKIPGQDFYVDTYKGYSFPATYVVECELPVGLPNTPAHAKAEAMLVVDQLEL
jgi:hypothetical protein